MSADAAIVAVPGLLAAALAVWAGEASFALAAEREAALPAGLLLPSIGLFGFALAWTAYYCVVRLLAYRALSTSNGLIMFVVMSALALVLLLLNMPERTIQPLAAFIGVAAALRLVRLRPRCLRSSN